MSRAPDVTGAPPGPQPDAPPLLTASNLQKRYGDRTVVDLEQLELRPGELLAVLGPNGAGKSTLLRLLSMLEKPTSGRVAFRGLSGSAAEARLRSSSSVVFQRPHFWRETVHYNIGLGLRLRRLSHTETDRKVRRIAADLSISGLLKEPVASLSGGQAQRVALARALVLEPEVLFLDEPTANLDSEARIDLRTDLESVVRQRTTGILLITHDRNEAFHLADRIAVLRDGRLVQAGSPADLYEEPADPYVARMTGAELTINARVTGADGRLLTVDASGVELSVVGRVGVGETVKVAYRPEDLILTPAGGTLGESSVRNLLYATISQRKDMGGLVRLRLDGPPELVALVTRNAAEELELDAGSRVMVRAKATALHAYPSAGVSAPAATSPDHDGAATTD